jgi:hypothetical protein
MPIKYGRSSPRIWVLMPNELQMRCTSETIWTLIPSINELLILIEEEFSGVEFSDDAVEQIEHVGDLIRYMEINCLLEGLYAQTFRKSAA